MKKVLSIIVITAAVAVVMTACKGNSVTPQQISYDDTVGFSQFQAWKAMNERVDPSMSYGKAAPVAVAKKRSYAKSGSMNSSTTNTAQSSKKKGWSKSAKYAAIGGGSGAILGAVINKRNRVAGGIIGGILGGGVGYGIGRSQDKKDGRY